MKWFIAPPQKVRLGHFGGAFRLVKDAAREVGAACAINFPFFAMSKTHPAGSYPVGQVMLGGKNVVLTDDIGHFHAVYRKGDAVRFWHWLPEGCDWGVRAGPRLLEGGKVCDMSVADIAWEIGGVYANKPLPRVAIGTRADGMTVLAYSDAATLREMAAKLRELGCVEALAGDGGGSASWYTPDEQIGARLVPGMVYVEGDQKKPDIPQVTCWEPAVDIDLNFSRHITTNFTLAEFACKCGCGAVSVSPKFVALVDKLQRLRDRVKKPVHVTSGYRCAKHDAAVGTSSEPGAGPHTTGAAADIYVAGMSVDALAAHAKAVGFSGIGKYRSQNFVHVDLRQPAGEWEA